MMSEVCKNDSDSDSLPELSDLLPAPSNEISKGDIVWAKFKKLYWPALVRNVYHKEKKITVWFADEPGKSFKLSLKNVFLFHDREMTTKIKNDVKETQCSQTIQAHEGLTSHAMTYLNRKTQGYDDDPSKFFDQTYPFFLVEDFLEKNPSADKNTFNDIKIEPMYISHNNSMTDIRKKRMASEEAVQDDSEIESIEDEIECDEDLSSQYKKIKTTILAVPLNAVENEYINKIVKCVTSGKADAHLINVISKTISSEHHEFYLKAIYSDRRDLDFISYGPVGDIKKLTEISIYLLDLYDLNFCKQGEKHEIKSSLSHLNDSRTEQARYVKSVWLPESIIFAISEINNISLSEAKKLFKNIDSSNKDGNISEVTDTTNGSQKAGGSIENAESKDKRSRLNLSGVLKDTGSEKYIKDSSCIPEIVSESCKKSPRKPLKRRRRRRKSCK